MVFSPRSYVRADEDTLATSDHRLDPSGLRGPSTRDRSRDRTVWSRVRLHRVDERVQADAGDEPHGEPAGPEQVGQPQLEPEETLESRRVGEAGLGADLVLEFAQLFVG